MWPLCCLIFGNIREAPKQRIDNQIDIWLSPGALEDWSRDFDLVHRLETVKHAIMLRYLLSSSDKDMLTPCTYLLICARYSPVKRVFERQERYSSEMIGAGKGPTTWSGSWSILRPRGPTETTYQSLSALWEVINAEYFLWMMSSCSVILTVLFEGHLRRIHFIVIRICFKRVDRARILLLKIVDRFGNIVNIGYLKEKRRHPDWHPVF